MEHANDPSIRSIDLADISPGFPLGEKLLALNNSHAQELSWLELARFEHLVREAFYARPIGELDAFMIAFDQDAKYDSPNFLWFRDRYSRFVYVDRIVTAAQARGRGLAQRLYLDLFEQAARAGHERVVCEINLSPPNPGSDAFHASLGFTEVGSAAIHGGTKTVRYLARTLS